MAKSAKKNRGSASKPAKRQPAKKPASSRSGRKPAPAVPPQPRVSYANQIKEIAGKYEEALPSNLKRSLQSVRKEIHQVMGPIYNLNRKIKEAPTRYKAAQYRKEKRFYEELITPIIADLKERRGDYVAVQKAKEAIRIQEKQLKRELRTAERHLKKADEAKDYKSLEAATYQVIKLQGQLDAMAEALGRKIKRTDVEGYEPSEEEDRRGFIEDPNNPYTIWEAIKQLHADEDSGEWLWFIIDGTRYSGKSVISIAVAASEFWLSLKKRKTDTPRVNRYFNLKTKTVKYAGFYS